jgi:hypothetical protein
MWSVSLFGSGPAGFDFGGDAAARAEVAVDDGPHRVAGFHHVFENLINDVFLKYAEIAVAEEVFLERFEFEATGARRVADGEVAEVGQAGFGTNRGQFRVVDDDLVAGKLILPCLDFRKPKIETGFCMIVGIARLLRHVSIVRGTKMNTV